MKSKSDNFYRKKLKNGLIILFEKRKIPVVSVSASVREGFAFESEKEKGISHFTEHLMFKGTKTRSHKQLVEEIEKKGGVLNAYTDEEFTSYWNKLPSRHFFSGLKISSDLILNPKFSQQEFEKEKRVILEEIKMYKDNPQMHVLDKIKSLLYKKPFGISGIGTEKNILGFTREKLIRFFNKNYSTNKMFLCVVGAAKFEEIEKFGNRFPKIFSREKKARAVRINKQMTEKRKGIDQTNFVLGFHAADLTSKKRYDHEIFNAILAGGMSSKLFEEIREKRGLAYTVHGILEQGKGFGHQLIYVGTTKQNVKKCKEIILKEIGNMKNIERKDFEEAKEQLIGLRKVGSEESVNVMNALAKEEVTGDATEFYNYESKIIGARLENVKAISKLKGFSSFTLIPK